MRNTRARVIQGWREVFPPPGIGIAGRRSAYRRMRAVQRADSTASERAAEQRWVWEGGRFAGRLRGSIP